MESIEEKGFIMICSRCDKKLENGTLFYEVGQTVAINRITEEGIFDKISNLSEPTHEYLCEDCFNLYVDKMNELMEETQTRKLVNMVEIIDDVQF